MTGPLDALLDAFERTDRRLAVFDRTIRERVGQWTLADPVPVEAVLDAFLATATARGDRVAQVPIPLHEPDTAELTGEFLAYRPADEVVVYHDYGVGGPATVPADALGETALAWRLRFWHPEHEPPATPSFLATERGTRGWGLSALLRRLGTADSSDSAGGATAATSGTDGPSGTTAPSEATAPSGTTVGGSTDDGATVSGADAGAGSGTGTAATAGDAPATSGDTTASSAETAPVTTGDGTATSDEVEPDTVAAGEPTDTAAAAATVEPSTTDQGDVTTTTGASTADEGTERSPEAGTTASAGGMTGATTDAAAADAVADDTVAADAAAADAAAADVDDAPDGGAAAEDEADSGPLGSLLAGATSVLRSSGPGEQDRGGAQAAGADSTASGSAANGSTGGPAGTAPAGPSADVTAPDVDAPEPATVVGPDADLDTFEAARRFVEREREAERAATREQFAAMSPSAFCARNAGIEHARAAGRWHDERLGQVCGLTITDEVGEARSGIDVPEACGIYPGNEVIVDTRRPGDGLPVEAEVLEIEGAVLHLGVYWDTASDRTRAERAFEMGGEAEFAVARTLNPTPHDRLLEGIRDCEADDRKAAIVRGGRAPAYGDPRDLGARATGLNEYQTAAVEDALAAEDVHVVHGPPGTGKTRTLVAIVREAVERGDRVLAVAHSNQAVDNLLVGGSTRTWTDPRSLHASAEAGDLSIARAGDNSRNDLVRHRYADASTWQADVVGATTNACHRFVTDGFDFVVVDEAAQASVASTLLAYSRAERAVLAGDHRQLPPYTAAEGEHDVASSLFERLIDLHGEDVASFLARQYRMHAAIAAFPNEAFYGGRLEHGEENRNWTIREFPPLVARQVDGTEAETPGTSLYNEAEARAAAREVSTLLQNGVAPKDVGIITPYAGQASKIAGELAKLDREGLADEIKVDTVDSFQGGERSVIVVSFVRSNPEGTTGFLSTAGDGPRRLNVALTRAQRRLVLLGDWETLRAADGEGGWALRALARHVDENGLLESV